MSETDKWMRLRAATPARVGLGNAGTGLPTDAMLDFQADHACARDAVHATLDTQHLADRLSRRPAAIVTSRAEDRQTYLRRPDLGRRLSEESAKSLEQTDCDIAFVLADGLSALAVERHAIPLLTALGAIEAGYSEAPVVIATQARVALGDDIGERLRARLIVMLIGERPGLSSSDSLGIYTTWHPHVGRRDHERNCISNVREPDGLAYPVAATQIDWLVKEARRLSCTGVSLKMDLPVAEKPSSLPAPENR
ncbi:ethanolamine ammonia-lyase subunit EutC [Novosphingobium aquimarinum]|uniref:ethanolamine ammonia-lyase subunit EutC n=1 Tax=Novosphingobium aquimarinum TaxID=2682494 RepID=UPI001E5D3550|nr:ethanolamine ammonia-lyase subunit EutC [Novosphingobium aquimarinum]